MMTTKLSQTALFRPIIEELAKTELDADQLAVQEYMVTYHTIPCYEFSPHLKVFSHLSEDHEERNYFKIRAEWVLEKHSESCVTWTPLNYVIIADEFSVIDNYNMKLAQTLDSKIYAATVLNQLVDRFPSVMVKTYESSMKWQNYEIIVPIKSKTHLSFNISSIVISKALLKFKLQKEDNDTSVNSHYFYESLQDN